MSDRLLDELAIISMVAKQNPDGFRANLIAWVEETNRQRSFERLTLCPDWSLNQILAMLDDQRIRALAEILWAIETEHLKGFQLSLLDEVEPYYMGMVLPATKAIAPDKRRRTRRH